MSRAWTNYFYPYTHYHSTFNADAGRLRLDHALPNDDVVNLDRDNSK